MGRKLTTHSAHFIYGYNGVGHMVKEYTDSQIGNPLPQGFSYIHHPTDRIAHTNTFVIPVVEHWLERENN